MALRPCLSTGLPLIGQEKSIFSIILIFLSILYTRSHFCATTTTKRKFSIFFSNFYAWIAAPHPAGFEERAHYPGNLAKTVAQPGLNQSRLDLYLFFYCNGYKNQEDYAII
jgi:hypothetical protein